MRNRIVGIVALTLMATVMMACAGGSGSTASPMSPSSPTQPAVVTVPVTPSVVSPQVGAAVTEGGQLNLSISTAGYGSSTGRTSMALVLVREDGALNLVGCSSWSGGAQSTMNISQTMRPVSTFPNGLYAWAKGHTLDGLALSATGVVFDGGCYFSPDTGPDPRPVYVEKATTVVRFSLGWVID